jgi:hypothetical protein
MVRSRIARTCDVVEGSSTDLEDTGNWLGILGGSAIRADDGDRRAAHRELNPALDVSLRSQLQYAALHEGTLNDPPSSW